MASWLDGHTINEFHRRANELENDDDESALEKIWVDICKEAEQSEAQWNALSEEDKANYPISQFWKRNVGLPRRLSARQKTTLTASLRRIFG